MKSARVVAIRDPYRSVEARALVPSTPKRPVDHRPKRARVIQSSLRYCTDYDTGLYIREYDGR
jgi:hypothetical protein